ncbi:hypothetical protein ABI59_11665 [Acidobacteria bacterium Mor1]|nr:hypothetical protein ABI59_11665 [Acidobacteria bacterium Mor1]
MNLSGIILPLATPLNDDRLDLGALKANLEIYESVGVNGYLAMGSSGEAVLFDESEKLQTIKQVRASIPSDRPLIAGTGMESTPATIRLTKQAADAGANFALISIPFYYRSQMTEQVIVRHYSNVAKASPIPILLYHAPQFTRIQFSLSLMSKLAEFDNVAGVKDSAGNIDWLGNLPLRVPENFEILCGNARIFEAGLQKGATGGVLAAGNIFPEVFKGIYDKAKAGKGPEAGELQAKISGPAMLLGTQQGVAGLKAAMDLRGLRGGDPRLPLVPLDEGTKQQYKRELEKLIKEDVIASLSLKD